MLRRRSTRNVHHTNGDKRDNRLANLELVDHAEHARQHTTERHRRRRQSLHTTRGGK